MKASARMACCVGFGLAAVLSCVAQSGMEGTLATSDVTMHLDAGARAPQVIGLKGPGGPQWVNTIAESLPAWLVREGQRVPLHWQLVRARSWVRAERVAFVYESQTPHLRLTWEWRARARFGPLEHRILIENLSGEEWWIAPPDSLQVSWSVPASEPMEHLYIDKGAGAPSPVGTHRVAVGEGYRWTGRSTTFAHPSPGDAPEVIPYEAVMKCDTEGRGWFAGIEFSGRTRLTLDRGLNRLSAVLGLDPEPGPVMTRLTPGDTFETPTVFLGAFAGGDDGAGNELRPWVRAVLGNPRTWQDPQYPLMVNNSWGIGMDINEHTAEGMIADAADLGFEMFHLDAGWFRGVGDWYPSPQKFPHGLAPIAEDAHRHGLRFGLWVDWSQAGSDTEPGALNLRDSKVRDWLVADVAPDWKAQDFKGQTIDLGVPAARDYAAGEVERIVTDDHLDMLEHDGYLVAQGCTRADHPHAPPDPERMSVVHYDGEDIVTSANSTDVSYHAVRGYYSIYEGLRRKHPGILLEICNDGGRMVDFGSAAHGDYFSIVDTYTPLANRQAFYDASFVLPPAMLEAYVDKGAAPSIGNFLYALRSGMMGWFSVMQNTRDWTPEQHAAARQALDLYRTTLRPLIRDAQLFHIAPRPDGIHWDGTEYWDPGKKQGAVFAFRGSDPLQGEHRFRLAGLRQETKYHLHFEDGTTVDASMPGKELMTAGLPVAIAAPLSSEVVLLSAE
jgi:hypothetical protein